jgi:hypothetical protein
MIKQKQIKQPSFWVPVKIQNSFLSKPIKSPKLFGFKMAPRPNNFFGIKPITPVKLSLYPKRTSKEIKLIDKKPFGDRDRDKIPNFFDCRPSNRFLQGSTVIAAAGGRRRKKKEKDLPKKVEKFVIKKHGKSRLADEYADSLIYSGSGDFVSGPYKRRSTAERKRDRLNWEHGGDINYIQKVEEVVPKTTIKRNLNKQEKNIPLKPLPYNPYNEPLQLNEKTGKWELASETKGDRMQQKFIDEQVKKMKALKTATKYRPEIEGYVAARRKAIEEMKELPLETETTVEFVPIERRKKEKGYETQTFTPEMTEMIEKLTEKEKQSSEPKEEKIREVKEKEPKEKVEKEEVEKKEKSAQELIDEAGDD